jgi:anti-sigma B factor antagonist
MGSKPKTIFSPKPASPSGWLRMDAEKPQGRFDDESNTVALLGEWDLACRSELRQLTDALQATLPATIDLTGATFVDSSVINEIVRTNNRLGAIGGRLRLRIGDDRIGRLFTITGIDQVIEIDRQEG